MLSKRHTPSSCLIWLGFCGWFFFLGLAFPAPASASWFVSRVVRDPSLTIYVSSGTAPKRPFNPDQLLQGPSVRFEYEGKILDLFSIETPKHSCSTKFHTIRVRYGNSAWFLFYQGRAEIDLRFFKDRVPSIESPQGFLLKKGKPMFCLERLWTQPRSLSSLENAFPAGYADGKTSYLCRLRRDPTSHVYGVWDGKECRTLSSSTFPSLPLEILTASPLHFSWVIPAPFAPDETPGFFPSISTFCRVWTPKGVFPGVLKNQRCFSPFLSGASTSYDILVASHGAFFLSPNRSPSPLAFQEIRYLFHRLPHPTSKDQLGSLTLSFFKNEAQPEKITVQAQIKVDDLANRTYTQTIRMELLQDQEKKKISLQEFEMEILSSKWRAIKIKGAFEPLGVALYVGEKKRLVTVQGSSIPSFFRWELLASNAFFQKGFFASFDLFDFSDLQQKTKFYTYAGPETIRLKDKDFQAHRFHSPDGREALWLSEERKVVRIRLDGGERFLTPIRVFYRGINAFRHP